MRTKRQGIIVWFQHMKNLKQLKRYGNLLYASKKLKYAVIYVDQTELEEVESRLLRHSFVSRVDLSFKPEIRTEFEGAKPDKAKQYDYKMGI
ncbi:DUF2129 domain-containing protein [Ornithinibacillus sp. L9]|uniref:UPF0298 protein GMD78_14380 n=1 Tax=Ornithinibacillus caprae TaxID=2678566 RepID=A0A6N8FK28_9BACI|nr:DUF2129 domain-containing protein [Ornithinibacillus caprae]MUK89551.1 DUF2129 domain-containing protein [Ornithinibacillus caprae]